MTGKRALFHFGLLFRCNATFRPLPLQWCIVGTSWRGLLLSLASKWEQGSAARHLLKGQNKAKEFTRICYTTPTGKTTQSETPHKYMSTSVHSHCSSIFSTILFWGKNLTRLCRRGSVTFWRFASEHKLLFLLLILHPNGKTRDTFSVFHHAVIFTAAIHWMHTPVETDCLEPHLLGHENHACVRTLP